LRFGVDRSAAAHERRLATLQLCSRRKQIRVFSKASPAEKTGEPYSRFDADVLRQTSPEIPHVLIGSSAGPADRRVGGMICRIHVNEQAGKALP